mgnify:CR=1 FL=1
MLLSILTISSEALIKIDPAFLTLSEVVSVVRESEVPLLVSKELEPVVLFVRFRGTKAQLRLSIEEAIFASWIRSDKFIRIGRTKENLSQMLSQRSRNASDFLTALSDLSTRTPSPEAFRTRWAEFLQRLVRGGAPERAQTGTLLETWLSQRFLHHFGEAGLGSMEIGDVRIFSSLRESSFLSLPPGFLKDIEFIQDFYEQLRGHADRIPEDGAYSTYKKVAQSSEPLSVGSVFVRLIRTDRGIIAHVRVFSSTGSSLGSGWHQLAHLQNSGLDPLFPQTPILPPARDRSLVAQLRLTDQWEDASEILRENFPSPLTAVVERSLREPLSLLTQHFLEQLSPSENLVAWVPDSAETAFEAAQRTSPKTESDVYQILSGTVQCEVLRRPSGILIRPMDPLRAGQMVVSRRGTTTLWAQIIRTKELSFATRMAFWRAAPPLATEVRAIENRLRLPLPFIADVGMGSSFESLASLQFAGSLSDSQWKLLKSGNALPFASLTPVQKDLAYRWVRDGGVNQSPELEARSDFERSPFFALAQLESGSTQVQCLNEEVYVGAPVEVHFSGVKPTLKSQLMDGVRFGQTLNEERFAALQQGNWAFGRMPLYRLQLANGSQFVFEQAFADVPTLESPAQGVPFEELPSNFRQDLAKGFLENQPPGTGER